MRCRRCFLYCVLTRKNKVELDLVLFQLAVISSRYLKLIASMGTIGEINEQIGFALEVLLKIC